MLLQQSMLIEKLNGMGRYNVCTFEAYVAVAKRAPPVAGKRFQVSGFSRKFMNVSAQLLGMKGTKGLKGVKGQKGLKGKFFITSSKVLKRYIAKPLKYINI